MKFVGTGLLTIVLCISARCFSAQAEHAQKQQSQRNALTENQLSSECPYQTAEEWQEFLDHYAGEQKWIETCEDSTCDHEYYQFVKENIQSIFDRCQGFIAQHQGIDQCTQNMRSFTPFWLKQHDSESYGFMADNHTYLTAQNAPDKPQDMMKVPDAIVAALPYQKDVEEAARKNGLQYLTHDSAIDGVRTFIFIPDPNGRYDKWMLLNLKSGNPQVKEKTQLSVLAVQKADSSGKLLPQVRLHFRDYTIEKDSRKNNYHLSLNEFGNGKCFSCHANGVRQLIPIHTPVLQAKPVQGEVVADDRDFAYQRLMQFNRKLRSYGKPDWDGNVIAKNIGPVLGEKQRCTDCHNGESRGVLSVFASTKQIEQKMYHELSMPPDTSFVALMDWRQTHKNSVSPADLKMTDETLQEAHGMHAALTKDFESSRLPALKDWFLRTSCH